MQGRPGQSNEPWDKSASSRMAALNGTGKQRAIPQRPPGMARVKQPPSTPRVARPKRENMPQKTQRKRLLIGGGLFMVLALFACIGGYIFYNTWSGITASAGASTAATNFIADMSQKKYDDAYRVLGPAITLSTPKEQFVQQVQLYDRCYGPITDFKYMDKSAVNDGNTQSYTYTITREKLKQPYEIRLKLQPDRESTNWKITDYGSLVPASAGKCDG